MDETKKNQHDAPTPQADSRGKLRLFDMSVQQRLELLSDERDEDRVKWEQTNEQVHQLVAALRARTVSSSLKPSKLSSLPPPPSAGQIERHMVSSSSHPTRSMGWTKVTPFQGGPSP